MVNQLQLVASVLERDAIRYTPVGIPVITAVLKHHSKQLEAGIERTIEFEIPVIAIGKIATQFEKIEIGKVQRFIGFLTNRSQKSKNLVFHLTDITSITNHE